MYRCKVADYTVRAKAVQYRLQPQFQTRTPSNPDRSLLRASGSALLGFILGARPPSHKSSSRARHRPDVRPRVPIRRARP
eukprot:5831315-Prymnesium_polylepis.1